MKGKLCDGLIEKDCSDKFLPMEHMIYTIRKMKREELDLATEWAALEGWNPGRNDAGCFFAADPDGFLVGLLDGKPVATLSVVKYEEQFGFLGFYIVKPGFRGKGFGIRIWEEGLRYLEGMTIGLDGVVSQQENYARSGFVLAHNNIRYEGTSRKMPYHDGNIYSLEKVLPEDLFNFDRQFFPSRRRQFLEQWISSPGTVALGWTEQDSLKGYGVIRPCRNGYKVGPLFAMHEEIAGALLTALLSGVPEKTTYYLDVPEVNPEAIKLAERYRMHPVFSTARMYSGPAPTLPLDNIFGITSFELG